MNILGLNVFHADTSACVLKDGKMVAAVEEERFTRIKHFTGFPKNSIDYCLKEAKLNLNEIDNIYVNRGPGSFAGIRSSLSIVKGLLLTKKIDYYCFSFLDFNKSTNIKYEDVPILCDKFKIKKNLINPLYLS